MTSFQAVRSDEPPPSGLAGRRRALLRGDPGRRQLLKGWTMAADRLSFSGHSRRTYTEQAAELGQELRERALSLEAAGDAVGSHALFRLAYRLHVAADAYERFRAEADHVLVGGDDTVRVDEDLAGIDVLGLFEAEGDGR
jgi:hypothetical protein